eukprot:1185742-Prorocentrum_minimum.AAC.1
MSHMCTRLAGARPGGARGAGGAGELFTQAAAKSERRPIASSVAANDCAQHRTSSPNTSPSCCTSALTRPVRRACTCSAGRGSVVKKVTSCPPTPLPPWVFTTLGTPRFGRLCPSCAVQHTFLTSSRWARSSPRRNVRTAAAAAAAASASGSPTPRGVRIKRCASSSPSPSWRTQGPHTWCRPHVPTRSVALRSASANPNPTRSSDDAPDESSSPGEAEASVWEGGVCGGV